MLRWIGMAPLAGYDVDHSSRLAERAVAAYDAREGALVIICENVGEELLSVASVEIAAHWLACRSAGSTSAESGSWCISHMFSSPAAWYPARPLAGRVSHGVRMDGPAEGRIISSDTQRDSTLGRRTVRSVPASAGRELLAAFTAPALSFSRHTTRISPGGTPDVPAPGSGTELRRGVPPGHPRSGLRSFGDYLQLLQSLRTKSGS